MTFSEFVTAYWNKTRRSGQPWTDQTIADDSGIRLDDVDTYLNWCHAQGNLSDTDLIARFEARVEPVQTPYGLHLGVKNPPAAPGTLAGLVDELKAVIAKYGG